MLPAGWLYLFSVLAAAGLLFTMVFYVSSSPSLLRLQACPDVSRSHVLDYHVLRPGVRLHQPY